ncbi:FkbM family methyltransferase [Phormidium sp. CCY1219]|uniref:FkbM family methyltransferase n=1 Tax=Phormidium sp. CCY1219 TaxID=2886104 RepID=UPI002D1F0329|nr:FkbM family methyltransferase [Phormidium sp. CCY1219]MEB3830754.1 FkbM family methyltransferase [Phormidium sp. CCY1219]
MVNVKVRLENAVKESVKGTFMEPLARRVADIINPPSPDVIASRKDDALAYQMMERILDKSSNCIDIGCNMGDFLTKIIEFAPEGHHYAFEPIPHLAERLKKRFTEVEVKQVALSDKEGETTFWYVPNAPALSGLEKRDYTRWGYKNVEPEPLPIKIKTLDNLLDPDFPVRFIKLDVEGAEMQVFQGANRILKTYQPYLYFEYGRSAKDYYETTPEMMYDFLVKECGYKLYSVRNWLAGVEPYSYEEFVRTYKGGSAWNFLASP